MNILSTLFALAISSHTPVQAGSTCAVQLMSYPGSYAGQHMLLTQYQKRRINTIRLQTRSKIASLNLQLRQVNRALASQPGPWQLRRLRAQKATLVAQINSLKARGISRINAQLTRYQRTHCSVRPRYYPNKTVYRGAARPAPRKVAYGNHNRKWNGNRFKVKVTVKRPRPNRHRVKLPPKPSPYQRKFNPYKRKASRYKASRYKASRYKASRHNPSRHKASPYRANPYQRKASRRVKPSAYKKNVVNRGARKAPSSRRSGRPIHRR